MFVIPSLSVVAANSAACRLLGCAPDRLADLHAADLHPAPQRQRMQALAQAFSLARADMGMWTIVSQSGTQHQGRLSWTRVTHDGQQAILAQLNIAAPLPATAGPAPDTPFALAAEQLFHGLPGAMLVLTPGQHQIVAVTDEYAQAVRLPKAALLGQDLFQVFPPTSDAPEASCARALRASVDRVMALGITDIMGLQHFPIARPDGTTDLRVWLPRTKPIFGADGTLAYIVHRVEDVTDLLAGRFGPENAATGVDIGLVTHVAEARATLLALQERDIRLSAAEKLLGLAAWELDTDTGVLNWSAAVFDMYGVSPDAGAPSFDDYVAMVHVDDRDQMQAIYHSFAQGTAPDFRFQHRIVRAGGTVMHIRGVGTWHTIEGRRTVVGFVQDITDFKEIEEEILHGAQRKRLAGRLARLGNWRLIDGQERVFWCDETAAIHDEPSGKAPTLDEAIHYYLPEHRDRIRTRLRSCLENGTAINETLQIVTAKGRRVSVRTLGEPLRDPSGRIIGVEGAFQDISEVVAAQDAAATLSVRLRQTLESMSDAFMLLGSDLTFQYFNSRAEALLGRSREDMIGQNMLAVYPESRGNMFHTHYELALAENRPVWFQTYSTALGRWLEVNAYPTPDGLAVYARDITLRHEYEERLRLLESAVSRQNDILLITEAQSVDDPDGPKIVYVNDAFTRRTGYSREEVIGKTPRVLQGPRTQRSELDRIRHALEHWQPVRAELINYKKSGEEFWLELDIVPLANSAGAYTHFVAVQRDITKRMEAEQALRTNEERFRLIAKATGTAVWEWDVTTDHDWWSEGFHEIFGYRPDIDDAEQTQWMSHIHPDDKPRVDASINRLLTGQASVVRDRYRFQRADGSWAQVEDRAFAVRDAAGTVLRVLGSMTDISDQVQLEERLRQAQKMEAVGQLTGGVAHDFNNLLTIMLGNAEILSDSLGDQPALQRMAEMTVNAAERGAELTNRLLAFSRKQPLEPKVLNIGTLVLGIDSLLRRALPETVDLKILPDRNLWNTALDAGQLETALLNLTLNARDAMPDGGCLTIEITNEALDDAYVAQELDVRAGQYVMINVTDTGHGMEPGLMDRIFEPFFTTKGVGKGSGLGLSMIYGFVKQSGGHIRVYSEQGEGTSFRLYFPRSMSNADQPAPTPPRQDMSGGTETILVVEDEAPVRDHVVSQLRALGYTVFSAAEGAGALRLLEQGTQIDLLFTDIVMPRGMGGRDLVVAARAMIPDLKVLYTSGYTENAVFHNGKLDQGVDLLSKPYKRQHLAAKVRKVLDAG